MDSMIKKQKSLAFFKWGFEFVWLNIYNTIESPIHEYFGLQVYEEIHPIMREDSHTCYDMVIRKMKISNFNE